MLIGWWYNLCIMLAYDAKAKEWRITFSVLLWIDLDIFSTFPQENRCPLWRLVCQPVHPASYRLKLIFLDQKKNSGENFGIGISKSHGRPQTRTSEVLGTLKNRCCLKKCRNPGGHALRPRWVFSPKVMSLVSFYQKTWIFDTHHLTMSSAEDSGSPSPKSLTAAPLETTKGSGLANNSWTKGHPPPPTPADKFIGGSLSLNISCQTICQP